LAPIHEIDDVVVRISLQLPDYRMHERKLSSRLGAAESMVAHPGGVKGSRHRARPAIVF
jgi:hypothetical protein